MSYGFERGSAAKGFERMEEKIFEWEASQQISGMPGSTSSGADSAAVNAELERMKERLGSRQ
ncbi:hypothetical protein D3C81_1950840 [compost metagenome]